MSLKPGTRFVVVAAAVLLRAVQVSSEPPARPLHRDQILKLVQNYVPSTRLADLVKQRGIDFEPSADYLSTLQKAGAEPVLLEALRAANTTKPEATLTSATHPEAGQSGPGDAQAHLEAGRALIAQNKPEGALKEFHEALRLQPDSAEAHRELSAALFEMGELDGAIAEYRQAILLGQDSTAARIDLGLALYVKGDLEGAIGEYRQAVRLDPSDASSHLLLGNALAKKPDLEAAITEFREAVRLRPDSAPAHDGLGSALEQKNDLRPALEHYSIAHSLEPGNPDYRFHYEHLLHLLGH